MVKKSKLEILEEVLESAKVDYWCAVSQLESANEAVQSLTRELHRKRQDYARFLDIKAQQTISAEEE